MVNQIACRDSAFKKCLQCAYREKPRFLVMGVFRFNLLILLVPEVGIEPT
jgi:hypothetical protein